MDNEDEVYFVRQLHSEAQTLIIPSASRRSLQGRSAATISSLQGNQL